MGVQFENDGGTWNVVDLSKVSLKGGKLKRRHSTFQETNLESKQSTINAYPLRRRIQWPDEPETIYSNNENDLSIQVVRVVGGF